MSVSCRNLDDYLERAKLVQPICFNGIVHRLRHSKDGDDGLSVQGSALRDGRYHEAGRYEVLYTSLTLDTAWKEIAQYYPNVVTAVYSGHPNTIERPFYPARGT